MPLKLPTIAIGCAGIEGYRGADGGHERVAFSWTNTDGSGMTGEFEDGRLVAKSADRLK